MATVLSPLPALLVLRANCRMALARISHLRAQQSHFGGLQWMLRSRVHAVAFAHPVPVGSAMSIAVPQASDRQLRIDLFVHRAVVRFARGHVTAGSR